MYLFEILFGASFRQLFATVNEVNGLTKVEIENNYSDSFSYDELLEFDREVAKKVIRTMRDYPNYFEVENAYGYLLYDALKKIGALNYHNFDYVIKRGNDSESLCMFNDLDFMLLSFVNVSYQINKSIILKFDNKNKLTNFVSLYSNEEELNTLWIILHQIAIEILPYKADEQKWLSSIQYPEYNAISSTKFLQQLKTLQNAII